MLSRWLVLGLGLVVLAGAALTVLVVASVSSIRNDLQRINDQPLSVSNASGKLINNVESMELHLRLSLDASDPAEQESEVRLWGKHSTDGKTDVTLISERFLGDPALSKQLSDGFARYTELQRTILRRAEQGKPVSEVLAESAQQETELVADSAAVRAFAFERAYQLTEGIDSSVRSLLRTIGLASLLAVLVCTALIVAILRRRQIESELREQLSWEGHIRQALHDGRLLVFAQPIISVQTGDKWGEELLVRMQGSEDTANPILPGEFLPQAERFGLMPLIDRFMVGRAVELAAAGRRVSVNLSATTLKDPAMAAEIVKMLKSEPEAAELVTFEITETAALEAPEVARTFVDHVTGLGAAVALDDFGTGYGSFTELRDYKIGSIKIDLSFVINLASSQDDQRVVRVMSNIAKEFGISTTAEGVEDAQTLELLTEYGVDRAQGYYIGRPAPVQQHLASPS